MVQFLVVYIFIMVPYPHAFQVLLATDTRCKIKGFDSVGEAAYTTFKVMLNMVDFSEYDTGTDDISAIHTLHVTYVFTVAMLLVNFLIALLSMTVGETVEAGDVIMMLQRLSVITTVERRLAFVFPCFYKLLHRSVYKCENGIIYLQYSKFTGIKDTS